MPRPLITSANARELQQLAVASRRKAKADREAAVVAAIAASAIPATIQLPPQTKPPQEPIADDFTNQRLLRVRLQLERIDAMIATEDDPQRLDRLAAASMRLSDQEFALSNRPKPGNRRPGPERGAKGGGGVFWGANPAQGSAQSSSQPPAPAQPETPEEPSHDSP